MNPASANRAWTIGLSSSPGSDPEALPIHFHFLPMSSKSEILRKIEDLFYRKSFSDLSMDEIA